MDGMNRGDAIARLREHAAELKQLGVQHLYLFGSTARGDAHKDSDVDLFFDYERGNFSLFDLMDVKETAARILSCKTDIIEAIERVHTVLGGMALEAFELDWQKQWLVERGVEIISEASRRLPDSIKPDTSQSPGRRWPASATCCDTIMSASPRRSCGNSSWNIGRRWNASAARSWRVNRHTIGRAPHKHSSALDVTLSARVEPES